MSAGRSCLLLDSDFPDLISRSDKGTCCKVRALFTSQDLQNRVQTKKDVEPSNPSPVQRGVYSVLTAGFVVLTFAEREQLQNAADHPGQLALITVNVETDEPGETRPPKPRTPVCLLPLERLSEGSHRPSSTASTATTLLSFSRRCV